jgi:hypothetical protein
MAGHGITAEAEGGVERRERGAEEEPALEPGRERGAEDQRQYPGQQPGHEPAAARPREQDRLRSELEPVERPDVTLA